MSFEDVSFNYGNRYKKIDVFEIYFIDSYQ